MLERRRARSGKFKSEIVERPRIAVIRFTRQPVIDREFHHRFVSRQRLQNIFSNRRCAHGAQLHAWIYQRIAAGKDPPESVAICDAIEFGGRRYRESKQISPESRNARLLQYAVCDAEQRLPKKASAYAAC